MLSAISSQYKTRKGRTPPSARRREAPLFCDHALTRFATLPGRGVRTYVILGTS